MNKIGVLCIFLVLCCSFIIAEESVLTNEELAYKWLVENKTGASCEKITDVKDIAFTILAGGSNMKKCADKLEGLKSNGNNFNGLIKDTAIALIALDYANKDTTLIKEWLKNKTITTQEIDWYIQQYSQDSTYCEVRYDDTTYRISISPTMLISSTNLGRCLSISDKKLLKVTPGCYNKTIDLFCERGFNLDKFYASEFSSNLYFISGNTQDSNGLSPLSINVNSKCFPRDAGSSQCDYESTLWATYALKRLNEDVSLNLPYLNALANKNAKYLPGSFLILLNASDVISEIYENELLEIREQTGRGWVIPDSSNSDYYNTALALLALGTDSNTMQEVVKWLWYSFTKSSAWGNSILDTSFVLWSIVGEKNLNTSDQTTLNCVEHGMTCIQKGNCLTANDYSSTYICPQEGLVCCNKPLEKCSKLGGNICKSNQICTGVIADSIDSNCCVNGICENKTETTPINQTNQTKTKSECETEGYKCISSCNSDYYTKVNFDCDTTSKVCCKSNGTKKTEAEVPIWIWFIVGGIVVMLGVIVYIYKEKIKMLFFKSKIKKGSNTNNLGQYGNRPPFSPGSRPPMPPSYGPTMRSNYSRPMPPR